MVAAGQVTQDEVQWFATCFESLVDNMAVAIRGKRDLLRLALTCLVAEGHLLIEDVPGVGKTSIARAMAASLGLSWHRIQFTPDLLPSDVTGVTIWNQSSQQFEFRPGPVFASVVLGDEINRASPKTQSALLEVMEERQVTVDAHAYPVPLPFMVIATQNPIEMDGTYRLPEAQLDRFLMRISVGYPDADAEASIISSQRHGSVIPSLPTVATPQHIEKMIEIAAGVQVGQAVERYVVSLVAATRDVPEVRLGVSPRGSLALARASAAWAVAEGRSFVTPEDVKAMAAPVLAHRILLSPEAELKGRSVDDVLAGVLQSVPVPQTVDAF